MNKPGYKDVLFTESGRSNPDDRPMWAIRADRIRYNRRHNITGKCGWCGKTLYGEINIHESCNTQKQKSKLPPQLKK